MEGSTGQSTGQIEGKFSRVFWHLVTPLGVRGSAGEQGVLHDPVSGAAAVNAESALLGLWEHTDVQRTASRREP